MWRPHTIREFETAVTAGALEERHDFDAKRQLPASGKELAKDVAAMSTDGGMLVYGVAEDEQQRPRILEPIELAGAPERIDQIIDTSISGSPKVEYIRLRIVDDEARGYLLVLIPPSPEAPHQVTVGGDRRFYGRSDTGNRRLAEEEIARLYERRRSQGVSRDQLLSEYMAGSPYGAPQPGQQAFLHAFAQPALLDDELWDRAVGAHVSEIEFLRALGESVRAVKRYVQWGGTHLGSALQWHRRGADAWTLDTTLNDESNRAAHRIARADLRMDGRGYLFYGGAGDSARRSAGGPEILVAYETAIALNLVEFLKAVGTLYEAGGLHGFVDLGIAVVGLNGAMSSWRIGEPFGGETMPYQDDAASRTLRCDARDVARDPEELVRRLTGRLMRSLYGADLDPLARRSR